MASVVAPNNPHENINRTGAVTQDQESAAGLGTYVQNQQDVSCSQCGIASRLGSKFCSRCGSQQPSTSILAPSIIRSSIAKTLWRCSIAQISHYHLHPLPLQS